MKRAETAGFAYHSLKLAETAGFVYHSRIKWVARLVPVLSKRIVDLQPVNNLALTKKNTTNKQLRKQIWGRLGPIRSHSSVRRAPPHERGSCQSDQFISGGYLRVFFVSSSGVVSDDCEPLIRRGIDPSLLPQRANSLRSRIDCDHAKVGLR